MLRAATTSQESQQSLSLQRNIQVVQIRKHNRQEIFNKKRYQLHQQQNYICDNMFTQQGRQRNQQQSVQKNQYQRIINILKNQSYGIDDLCQLVQHLQQTDLVLRLRGVIGIKKILCKQPPPIQLVIDSGAVQLLIDLLQQQEQPQIKYDALWAISNISSGEQAQGKVLVQYGIIPKMLSLMRNNDKNTIFQSIWTLGNLTMQSITIRDTVINQGAIDTIVEILQQSQDLQVVTNACWLLSHLCRKSPLPQYQLVKPGLESLARTIGSSCIHDQQTLVDCFWAISYYCDPRKHNSQPLLDSNFLDRFVEFMWQQIQNNRRLTPGIRIIGGLCMGNSQIIQLLLDHGVLPLLQQCICHPMESVRKQSCWAISNIATGSKKTVQAILQRQQLMSDLKIKYQSQTTSIKKQICYIFTNMAHYSHEIQGFMDFYISYELLQPHLALLLDSDEKIVQIALNNLAIILQRAEQKQQMEISNGLSINKGIFDYKKVHSSKRGGINNRIINRIIELGYSELIQHYQHSQNDDIYNSAFTIINNYFTVQDPLDKLRLL